MPNLYLITSFFQADVYLKLKHDIYDTVYGFNLDTLFSMINDSFKYRDEVVTFWNYITGSNKEKDYPVGNFSIFQRIKNISQQCNGRTLNGLFHHIMIFLPTGGKGTDIDILSEALKSIMLENSVLNKYEIIIINSKRKEYINLHLYIQQCEDKACTKGKKGLILLSGYQASLAITLKKVDIVFLLNNTMSADRIIQMSYRCMSDDEDLKSLKKVNGYVVDFNLERVLNTICSFTDKKRKFMTVKDKINYAIDYHLITLDGDCLTNHDNQTRIVDKLFDIWKNIPINGFNRITQGLKVICTYDLNHSDQLYINK